MSVADVAALKKSRGVIKGSCTRIKTYVNSVATPGSAEVHQQLLLRRQQLENLFNEFRALQSEIDIIEPEADETERAAVEDSYYNLATKMDLLLQQRGATNASPTPSASGSQSDCTPQVQLPRLGLPAFSGKYDKWLAFRNVFMSVIHSNGAINDTQKFQYLTSCLSGEAANVIESLEYSEDNYSIAWAMLRERYDNNRSIVFAHITALLEIPKMTRENDVELRSMVDRVNRNTRALSALKRPIDKWDDILVVILSAKLDTRSQREWRSTLKGGEIPTLKRFLEFLTDKFQALEIVPESFSFGTDKRNSAPPKGHHAVAHVATVKGKCTFCNEEHSIYQCRSFLKLPVQNRIKEIKGRKLCINCLRSSKHTSSSCNSGTCRTCHAKHNTLLHIPRAVQGSGPGQSSQLVAVDTGSEIPQQSLIVANASISAGYNLLSTAVAYALDETGSREPCRLLLDPGSQASFISRDFACRLGLPLRQSNISVRGIGQTVMSASEIATVKIYSRLNAFNIELECIVGEKITERMPAINLGRDQFKIPPNIRLADPQFFKPSDVDMIIGVDRCWDLFCLGRIEIGQGHPILLKTYLGWVLAGKMLPHSSLFTDVQSFCASIKGHDPQLDLTRFWEVEESGIVPVKYSRENLLCENHFLRTVSRNSDGRFVVELPFKGQSRNEFGDSRSNALRRFHSLKRRLDRDRELKTQYSTFIKEYAQMGHMQLIDRSDERKHQTEFYLPHHCVVKPTSNTTKLRVVFDASVKSSCGKSLNDVLMVGPVVQDDLFSILIRFRTHKYVFTSDIKKMYRQILLTPTQTKFHRILWRDNVNNEVQTYELKTLTYGTTPASFLATRCLNYLADQEIENYPLGAKHVKRDFYMDDILTGSDSIEETRCIITEVRDLLSKGCFPLDKWQTNEPELLRSAGLIGGGSDFIIDKGESARVLGIGWNSMKDTFYFDINDSEMSKGTTKRTILSDTAKIFDPLGLLGPVIMIPKLIVQRVWRLNTAWDESLPITIASQWFAFKNQLSRLNGLKIRRCVKTVGTLKGLQIHGFCDASEQGYGACVYVRSESIDGKFDCELLCSKSRVAPLKALSLPRLELCAAALLATLMKKINESLSWPDVAKFLWSDSMITLNWLSSHSRNWATFVANRVGEIQRTTNVSDWRHVESAHNPADVSSRGSEPSKIIDHSLWGHGPEWLRSPIEKWPASKFQILYDMPEMKKTVLTTLVVRENSIDILMKRFSKLDKLLRTWAYCLRFIEASKNRNKQRETQVFPTEMQNALHSLCKYVQFVSFKNELKDLKNNRSVQMFSRALNLSPFLDESGLIRVGGRLDRSELSYDSRHPILLPKCHVFNRLIIESEHVRNLHSGLSLTISSVRQRFWPIAIRSVARQIVRNCVTSFKVKPISSETIMSSLPASRVRQSKPFAHCGVDYAGPFLVKEGKRRNGRKTKSYLCVFVCFATKAVHLEAAGDLTSTSFLGAFKRFLARRGHVSVIYSDNGTNFVGARNEMDEFYEIYKNDKFQNKLREWLTQSRITWNFITPGAPHHGGLWEAAVKSAKSHLKRIMGNAALTFEELQTLFCEVEAILNSRPLTPISDDPHDLSVLTPGHFLIGEALNSFPTPDLTMVNESRLLRWQRVEQLRQNFWRRWHLEYLNTLQMRSKWVQNKGPTLQVGQVVLIKQTGLLPLQWLLGRVERLHPGSDSVVRSATIKTAKGELTRPISKLCILPLDEN